jgi:hypothetical protein
VSGSVKELLTITDDSGNAGTTQTATLNGTGTGPGASVSPSSWAFPNQLVGTTSAAKKFTLKSTGTGPLQITSLAVAGSFNQTNDCGGILAPASSCTIQVSFTPSGAGTASGTLTIVDNAGTQTVRLKGTGVAPVTASPATLNFGRVKVGGTSSVKTVTVTNHQKAALNFSEILASTGFAISSNTCDLGIAANASAAWV